MSRAPFRISYSEVKKVLQRSKRVSGARHDLQTTGSSYLTPIFPPEIFVHIADYLQDDVYIDAHVRLQLASNAKSNGVVATRDGMNTVLSLLRVSHAWYSIALMLVYRYPVLTKSNIYVFQCNILAFPHYLNWVKEIFVIMRRTKHTISVDSMLRLGREEKSFDEAMAAVKVIEDGPKALSLALCGTSGAAIELKLSQSPHILSKLKELTLHDRTLYTQFHLLNLPALELLRLQGSFIHDPQFNFPELPTLDTLQIFQTGDNPPRTRPSGALSTKLQKLYTLRSLELYDNSMLSLFTEPDDFPDLPNLYHFAAVGDNEFALFNSQWFKIDKFRRVRHLSIGITSANFRIRRLPAFKFWSTLESLTIFTHLDTRDPFPSNNMHVEEPFQDIFNLLKNNTNVIQVPVPSFRRLVIHILSDHLGYALSDKEVEVKERIFVENFCSSHSIEVEFRQSAFTGWVNDRIIHQ
ncbi:hypothetical protein C8Q75DRAFT_138860 [Abortiporus biennis]|nr:hypothetical protein C8Q75DRAFT_138860 [Abortiporus biennis]